MFLNANVPAFRCFLRSEYLYNLESHFDELVEVTVFGVASLPGRAIGWHVITEHGAVFWRLPISALVWRRDAPRIPLDHLELWDCFSYQIAVTRFDFLSGLRVRAVLKDGTRQWGRHMFTLDWCDADSQSVDASLAEWPDEHKCAHVLQLDNGCYAAQPNNRVFWHEPSFVVSPLTKNPGYKVNTHEWHCEGTGSWATEDSDAFFYGVTKAPE